MITAMLVGFIIGAVVGAAVALGVQLHRERRDGAAVEAVARALFRTDGSAR